MHSALIILIGLLSIMNNIRGFALGLGSRAVFKSNRLLTNGKTMTRMLSTKGGFAPLPVGEDEKAFYALGVNIAMSVGGDLKAMLTANELKHVIDGFGASLSGGIPDEREILQQNGKRINEIITQRQSTKLTNEKDKGKDFIQSYLLKNPRAQVLPSGLVYHEIIAGIGEQASPDSTVKVHYHGTFTDGKVFDSSVDRGQPIEFPLKQVIKGWQEGVAMMRVGGKATLLVPSDLAYGDAGSPPQIPGGATLRFDVELINTRKLSKERT